MMFTSVEFFAFWAALLVLLRTLTSESLRRNLLLCGSYLFYGWWDWRFCSLIGLSTLVDYAVSIRIEESSDRTTQKRWLALSLISNLGLLSTFKYLGFFRDSIASLMNPAGVDIPAVEIILPVGISFYTFQTMSYSIDVYRGTLPATRNFRDFALFVSFFPQLVAGPIVRGSDFLPQLAHEHEPARGDVRAGLELFARGFLKKVMFADTLSVLVDDVYADIAMYSTTTCWLAAIAYSLQIYYDFSGYSDMAIGVARTLGYRLPVNFKHPYLSRSITEFWRRWHISLSFWLRDYLYISLGGNRRGVRRTYINLMLTMLLGGLWHGAAWTFVVWGAVHGIALAGHKWWMGSRTADESDDVSRWRDAIGWVFTMALVVLCWVPFRAPTFEIAWSMLNKLAGIDSGGATWFYTPALVAIGTAVLLHLLVAWRRERELVPRLMRPWQWAVALLVALTVLFHAPLDTSPFIYFQF